MIPIELVIKLKKVNPNNRLYCVSEFEFSGLVSGNDKQMKV